MTGLEAHVSDYPPKTQHVSGDLRKRFLGCSVGLITGGLSSLWFP